jgi:hypothetical protein
VAEDAGAGGPHASATRVQAKPERWTTAERRR